MEWSADLLGWLAGGLTFLAFSMRDIVPLRLAALGANISFIGWALAADLQPILALHCILLPCNLYRLVEAMLIRRRASEARRRAAPSAMPPAVLEEAAGT